jgi:5-methylcytosine-specific restriction endonuclease McrA
VPQTREQYNEYMRVYMLNRYHERRAEALEKLGGACAICGSKVSLEIDHIDPKTKSFDVGKLWSVSKARYLSELEKCQLLCKVHHLRKSGDELAVPHGGGLTGKRNCRCTLCAPLKNAYNRMRKGR